MIPTFLLILDISALWNMGTDTGVVRPLALGTHGKDQESQM
jgi:hypothetical protein